MPYVKEYMLMRQVTEWGERGCFYRRALQSLLEHGAKADHPLAGAGLILWGQRHPHTAGRNGEMRATWGDRYPPIDYTSQELNIGRYAFYV